MNMYRLKGASGPVANQSFDLDQQTVIGHAPECDVVIDDAGLAARHALIVRGPAGELTVERLDDKAATLVNGKAIEKSALSSGDELRLGGCRFVVQAPGLRPEKVLTEEATRRRRSYLPWLIAGLLAAAVALAWQQGWLAIVTG